MEQVKAAISELIESAQTHINFDFFSGTGDMAGVVVFIFTALALYTIAKRRGIKNPWLAWIPVTQFWIIGSIADHYRLVACGKETKKRKIMLWLQIAIAVLVVVFFIAIIVSALSLLAAGYNSYNDPMDLPTVLASLGGVIVVLLLLCAAAVAAAVVQWMAMYDVFRSCEPKNASLYLVLSIVINITQPIFLMLCREKDAGMPCVIEAEPLAEEPQPEEPAENE